ncbi:hypothetical protein Tco_0727184 [Tanacetum coccineum]|uniref:Uncharacterized protein n=1 Tax=Tanacetum coccineum TaxID=301880 RepID=A0ABQ4YJW4_9ASTR
MIEVWMCFVREHDVRGFADIAMADWDSQYNVFVVVEAIILKLLWTSESGKVLIHCSWRFALIHYKAFLSRSDIYPSCSSITTLALLFILPNVISIASLMFFGFNNTSREKLNIHISGSRASCRLVFELDGWIYHELVLMDDLGPSYSSVKDKENIPSLVATNLIFSAGGNTILSLAGHGTSFDVRTRLKLHCFKRHCTMKDEADLLRSNV